MWITKQKTRLQELYREFPRPFWTLTGATFIDRVGGAISDRFGRRNILIFSLITTSTSTLLLGIADSLIYFYILVIVVGLIVESGQPARQAMVADLLPEEKRAEGYAIIVWRAMPETKPAAIENADEGSVESNSGGYGAILRDRLFIVFLGAGMLVSLIGMNLFTTLGVYLRDGFGVPDAGYGLLLSMNALLIVAFQIPIGRRIEGFAPMLVMAAGSVLYGIGFGMFAFVSTAFLFVTAMIVLTVGEMMLVPVSQSLVARFAPEDMRGRYMAMYGISWSLPFAFGPLLAGLVMDNGDPRMLFWISGLLGLLAAASYVGLHTKMRDEPAVALAEASA